LGSGRRELALVDEADDGDLLCGDRANELLRDGAELLDPLTRSDDPGEIIERDGDFPRRLARRRIRDPRVGEESRK